MKRSVWSQVLLGAFATLLLPAQLAYAQSQVGVSAAVRGSVDVRSGGVSRAPLAGEVMLLGDRVRTQLRSGMQVLLLDESVFTVGESNDLVIDRFVYDPDRGVGEIAARSTQGFLRFVSGGVGAIAPQNISLTTPSATIGTRGTSIDVVVGPDAVALAQQLGLIGPNDQVDPATAVFVILRGPAVQYGGITQRGRVIVETPAGSVEVRREGYGVFVPFAGAAPSEAVLVPLTIIQSVVESIELPGVGITQQTGGVNITDLSGIDINPGDVFDLPQPGDNNPDVTGTGFRERVSGQGPGCVYSCYP
ncbi:MAG: hypothetical protein Rhims3KO_17650 [Hyphomicrobiales bacterium]